uniref:Integrase catalytic domain-containing protein n=1 Tax=Tanacetum cinerariifolium TaxID=118510 RepID=A0A6L2J7Q3_TANCI|nr:hypothetical protein [Tanacetum cinerariifolium]
MFDCDDYLSSGSDESFPPSPIYDRYQSRNGYHAVPPLYTGTFMPPKPDLVFNNAPNVVETDHPAFNVRLSPTKPDLDLSQTNRRSTPIIEDWVSNLEDKSKTKTPHNVPSFVQSTEQVKSSRPSVQHVETSIPAATPKPTSPKPTSNGKYRNRKACFVCKILDHLIKDYDYHEKKWLNPLLGTMHTGKIISIMLKLKHLNPQRHMVPVIVLTQSKPVPINVVPINAVRAVSTDVPKFKVTKPRHDKPIVTKPNSPTRRHINHSPSPKASNSPPRVTVVQALVGNPQHDLKDKRVIDSRSSRYMTGNMSYLSDFEELNGGYVTFSGNPKGVKGNLVRGLPTKVFKNDNTCVACKKGKQHRASCKTKPVSSVDQPLYRLHMDLFRPTFAKSLNKKSYCLVVTDDYSRFTWVFFLATKDETSPILKTFITCLENQLSLKVKVIKSDNGTKFKNHDLNQFCKMKGIKREFSVPRTPQQNGVEERKNRTLVEAARTMLADSLLPIPFWPEAVNTACYILSKFDGKVDEGFLVGYSVSSKAFRVFNSRTWIVQETLHMNFLENKHNVAGSGPTWLKAREEIKQKYVLFPVWSSGSTNPHNTNRNATFDEKEPEFNKKKPESEVNVSLSSSAQSKKHDDKTKREAKGKSLVESYTRFRNLSADFEDFSENSINEVNVAGNLVPTVGQISLNITNTFSADGPLNAAASPTHGKSSCIDTSQLPDDPDIPELEDITYSDNEDDVGAEADFNNLETSITVSPISTTSVHKDHPVTQIIGNLSSATQTRSMTRVAKDQGGATSIQDAESLVKNKARLVAQGHTQEEGINYEEVFAPVARIEAIRLFLAYASFIGFMVYQMNVKSAFLYGNVEEEVYVCQPPGFEDPNYPDKVYKVVKALYGLHQAPGACQDKYVAKNLRKFRLTDEKSASSPIDTEKPLLKDPDDQKVSGKDSSNPLMADNLPKVVWYSTYHVALMKSWLVQKQMALGVNTPKSDEDRLKLMELTVFLFPSDEKVRVEVYAVDLQLFALRLILLLLVQKFLLFGLTNWCCSLNAVSLIKYALTVNPNIYVSCIKQFWTTVAVKKVNDITRLQALVDKKEVVVTKATIRDALCLDEAEGVECLPNEEIFAELARMGYEKPSTKLTFYKAFFLSQWKFLIHTILQCMSAKRTSWNEFSSSMASAVICLSSGRKFNFSKYIFDSLVRNVDNLTKFYMYPCFLQLMIRKQVGDLSTHTTKYTSPALTQKVFANMRRVGRGFSGVKTPLFKGMVVAQEVGEGVADEVHD